MGDRGSIYLVDSDIHFYTHSGGSSLVKTLQTALKRGKSRWGDEEYLARIIFSEMIKDEVYEKTGYGIGRGEGEGEILVVSIENETVNEVSFDEFIQKGR